jgi:hypothetical protein
MDEGPGDCGKYSLGLILDQKETFHVDLRLPRQSSSKRSHEVGGLRPFSKRRVANSQPQAPAQGAPESLIDRRNRRNSHRNRVGARLCNAMPQSFLQILNLQSEMC